LQFGNQHLPLSSQESNSEFSKLQSLLEAKKWLLQIEKQSLCWATTWPICVVGTSGRWDVDAIELLSKYRLTPQLENWQKVGGYLTAAGFQAVAHLSPSIPCAVTAIYSASQAVVCCIGGG